MEIFLPKGARTALTCRSAARARARRRAATAGGGSSPPASAAASATTRATLRFLSASWMSL
eukprot:5215914-Lingulodinium_polyedra.AAC.1